MGKSESTTEFTFEKNEFFPGEKANVRVVCDNSGCSKAVKSFKFKVHRAYKAFSHKKEHYSHAENYLSAIKEAGCGAKSKVDKVFKISIPNHDPVREQYFETHPDEMQSLKDFSCSMQGGLFSVTYNLRVFVKHDSWNEFGEGNCLMLPIKIWQNPVNILSSDVLKEPPSLWKPFVAQYVELALPNHHPTDAKMPGHYYYKSVIEPA